MFSWEYFAGNGQKRVFINNVDYLGVQKSVDFWIIQGYQWVKVLVAKDS